MRFRAQAPVISNGCSTFLLDSRPRKVTFTAQVWGALSQAESSASQSRALRRDATRSKATRSTRKHARTRKKEKKETGVRVRPRSLRTRPRSEETNAPSRQIGRVHDGNLPKPKSCRHIAKCSHPNGSRNRGVWIRVVGRGRVPRGGWPHSAPFCPSFCAPRALLIGGTGDTGAW